ncbi:hypothetical protein D1871_04705 [Nakamurella silvestris]|nr:hypothetical protein D1871_04705 [Nakamurella silvestris]
MTQHRTKRVLTAVAGGAALVLVLGGLVVNQALASPEHTPQPIPAAATTAPPLQIESDQPPPAQEEPPTAFQVNKNGQTYGSDLNVTSEDGEPDLIAAYSEDGKLGYALKADLFPPMPKSPEEALAQQKVLLAAGGRTIPLYSSDGETVIGTYFISPGQ